MSRIGNKAVTVPTGVTANVDGQTVKVKGPKGALQVVVHDDVSVAMDKGAIKLEPRGEGKRARSMWGTSRTLVANVMSGVTKASRRSLRSPASDIVPRFRERRCNCSSDFPTT